MDEQERETEKCPYCEHTDICCHLGMCSCTNCGREWPYTLDDDCDICTDHFAEDEVAA